jgi:hypothetical protein
MYWAEHDEAFFQKPGSDFCAHSFCVHLWQSFTWPFLEHLTENQIITTKTEFCSLLRPYLEEAREQ